MADAKPCGHELEYSGRSNQFGRLPNGKRPILAVCSREAQHGVGCAHPNRRRVLDVCEDCCHSGEGLKWPRDASADPAETPAQRRHRAVREEMRKNAGPRPAPTLAEIDDGPFSPDPFACPQHPGDSETGDHK